MNSIFPGVQVLEQVAKCVHVEEEIQNTEPFFP